MDIISLGKISKNTKNLASNKIVCLGDSITASTSGYNTPYPTFLSWMHGYTFVNAGVSGDRTADVLARIQTACIDLNPSHCILLIGTNDAGATFDLATVVMPNMHSICERLKANGIKPIICSILPRQSETALKQRILTYNRAYRRYCLDYGIQYIDLYSSFIDSAGTYISAYYIDGLHPTGAGKKIIADVIAAKTDFPISIGTCYPDETQALANNFFATDANSDGLADSWLAYKTGTVTMTYSLEAHPTYGNWQVFTITGGVSENSASSIYQETSSADYVAEGNIIDFGFDVITDALTDCTWSARIIGLNAGGSTVSSGFVDPQERSAVALTSLTRVFGTYTIPATVTKIRLQIYLYGTGNCTLKVGNVIVRKRDIW